VNVGKLTAGVFRTDLKMADGRSIHYYDLGEVNRSAVDNRDLEPRPAVGELRLDLLTNEWVAMAPSRQTRAFLPPMQPII
jgi:UDPglucose--hexose-1-phosphate uridylyltransferase